MSELPNMLLCTDNIYVGGGLQNMSTLCYLLDADSDVEGENDEETLQPQALEPTPEAPIETATTVPSATPAETTLPRPNPFKEHHHLLDASQEHLWLQPPHILPQTSAHCEWTSP